MSSPRRSLSSRAFTTLAAALALSGAIGLGGAAAHGATPAGPGSPAAGGLTATAGGGPRVVPLPPPRAFARHVTNAYFPLRPGTVWVYRGYGSEAGQREVVRVLHRTRRIEGIRATVVVDRATEDGRLIELTHDWYAQDHRGRVWYLGEATTSYDGGETSTKGSWRAGVDGARPGVVMFRRGNLNRTYWQEYLAGEAEDQGTLLTRRARAVVPAGRFARVRLTKDTTPLEPRVMELKFYARGVGLVLELGTSPELGRVELVRVIRPAR